MFFLPKNKTPLSFIKGWVRGVKFLKNGCNRGDGKCREARNWGGGGGGGRDAKFFKSLYIVVKRLLTLFYEDPLYCLSVPLPLCLSPQVSCHLSMLFCFFGRMGDDATFDVLFYLMLI